MATTDDTSTEIRSNANAPALLALQIMDKLLVEAIQTRQNVNGAQVDLRALRELRPRLESNPNDKDAVNWIRQIALRWSGQLRNKALRFRHLFDHLDLVGR